MGSPRLHARVIGTVLVAFVTGMHFACALRVGSGGPPSGGDPAQGEVFGASACARLGSETRIGVGAGAQSFAFAWDRDHYVLAFPDASSGQIFVGALASDGTAMGSPIRAQVTSAKGDLPSLLVTSSGYLVVWQEQSAGNVVYARALGADLTPLGDGVTVSPTRLAQPRPVVSRAPGGKAAITWMDQFEDGTQGVQVVTLDPSSMSVTGPSRLGATALAGWPWVAENSQTLGVVWREQMAAADGRPSYDVAFATLDPSSLQPSAPTSLRGIGSTESDLPRMIATGAGFLAAWEDRRTSDNQIFMAVVDSNAARVGGGLVEEPNSGDANWPNMAWTGQAAGVVYYQWRDARPQIFMSFVDGAGARVGQLHDLQVSNGTSGWSKYPDVAWTGSEFGVMYVDTRDGAPALWFQRVSCRP